MWEICTLRTSIWKCLWQFDMLGHPCMSPWTHLVEWVLLQDRLGKTNEQTKTGPSKQMAWEALMAKQRKIKQYPNVSKEKEKHKKIYIEHPCHYLSLVCTFSQPQVKFHWEMILESQRNGMLSPFKWLFSSWLFGSASSMKWNLYFSELLLNTPLLRTFELPCHLS